MVLVAERCVGLCVKCCAFREACNCQCVLFQTNFSALHLAAQNGHNQCCRILLFARCSTQHMNSVIELHFMQLFNVLRVTKIRIFEQYGIVHSSHVEKGLVRILVLEC